MGNDLNLQQRWGSRLRQLFIRAMGCTPATVMGTLLIFMVACSAAVAQELGSSPPVISMSGDMTLMQAFDLVQKFGWPAVATYLGHRLLKLLENGAKATEAGRPMLRLDVTHHHIVDDSRGERSHRRHDDYELPVHGRRRRDEDEVQDRAEDTQTTI